MRLSSNTLSLTFLYRLPVIALCLAIFWQSSYPGLIKQPLFSHADKLLHFIAYAFLAVLCARNLAAEKPFWTPFRIKIVTIFCVSLYGLSDEIHQAFVPARSASMGDFVADCTGSVAGSFFYLWKKSMVN
jgi:VanZ family protein